MKNFFKALGKGLLYFLLFIGAQLILSIIISFIAGVSVGFEAGVQGGTISQAEITEKVLEKVLEFATLASMISGILTVVVLIIEFLIRKKNFFKETSIFKIKSSLIAPIIFLGFGLNIVITLVMKLIPVSEDVMNSYAQSFNVLTQGNMVVNVIAIAIVAPIVEELIFRGLMLSRFQKGMPTIVAVILSSLLFGLVHGQILWMAYAFVLGLILSFVFIRTKSLVSSILLHFAFNSYSACLMVLKIEDFEDSLIPVLSIIGSVAFVASLVLIILLTIKDKNKIENIDNVEQVATV